MTWDEFFFRHVYLVSSKSKDTSTQIGAILVRDNRVIAEGYNGFPEGVNDHNPSRHERPIKYLYFEHGERNAVYQCARLGTAAKGSVMFTNGIPCSDCARAVIQAGVREIVVHKQWQDIEKEIFYSRKIWNDSCSVGETMLKEAGVKIRIYDGKLGIKSLMSGQIIEI